MTQERKRYHFTDDVDYEDNLQWNLFEIDANATIAGSTELSNGWD